MSQASPTQFDYIIIGGGIAGASIGYELSQSGKVLLLEREEAFGYHTTGRSAATYIELLQDQTIVALSRASKPFLSCPPNGFTESPLLTDCGCIISASYSELPQLEFLFKQASHLGIETQWLNSKQITEKIPIIRADKEAVYAALFETQAKRIDVDGLLQGYLKGLRARGGQTLYNVQIEQILRAKQRWQVQTMEQTFECSVLVNAAGAWGDILAAQAGVSAIGLEPKKRTMVTFDGPADTEISTWPMMGNISSSFYFLPESGQLMGSPADQSPSPPCDTRPDELDIATAIYTIEQHTHLKISKVNHSWAGLRTFSPDSLPVIGFEPLAKDFFWFVGQGGFGIQTAPALAQLGAALLLDKNPKATANDLNVDLALLLPNRFR